jgi:hypothetical protein
VKPSLNLIVRLLRRSVALAIKPILAVDYAISGTSSNFSNDHKPQIWNGADDELLVYFIHFDKRDLIDESDQSVVRFLKDHGYNVRVITNNPKLQTNESSPIFAKNLGRDLGVYRDITQILFEMGYGGKVILLNNSIAWIADKRLIYTVEYLKNNCDHSSISTLVESFQPTWHHQSFAFGIDFKTKYASSIFSCIKNSRFKRTLINYGEMQISKVALKQGLSIHSMLMYRDVIKKFESSSLLNSDRIQIQKLIELDIPLNPTQHFWREIISLGFPGYKKNLSSSNPAKLTNLPIDFTDMT